MTEEERLEAMRALCHDQEAVDLLRQLWNGLVHPLEYAAAIILLAIKYNLSLGD